MRQKIIILASVLISVSAIAYAKWNNPKTVSCQSDPYADSNYVPVPDGFSFVYDINPRFFAMITLEDLHKSKNITDILPPMCGSDNIQSYYNVKVNTFNVDRASELHVQSEGKILNDKQLELIRNMEYGDNFYITGNCDRLSDESGMAEKDSIVRYFSIVPYEWAKYEYGKKGLIKYLKENSKDKVLIAKKSETAPGKINFTITKEGHLEGTQLESTCGYESIDKQMLNLLNDLPGSWQPAKNENGENVKQVYTFFFGQIGC